MTNIQVDTNDFLTKEKLYIGFSGGLDSTVLLHLLVNIKALKHKIIAVHINHGLSKNALSWERFCQKICLEYTIPLIVKHVIINKKSNIEEEARNARYHEFAKLIERNDALILAHHQNDQAETLLLNLMRGAGIDGLSAMPKVNQFKNGTIIRPLLSYSRQSLEEYAKIFLLSWIEDESNRDEKFSRNFLRHKIIPLLEEKWPNVCKSLTRAANNCQYAQENLKDLAYLDYEISFSDTKLLLKNLVNLNYLRKMNVIRTWLKTHNIIANAKQLSQIDNEIINAATDKNPALKIGNILIKRYQDTLYLVKNHNILFKHDIFETNIFWVDFPKSLSLQDNGSLEIISANNATSNITQSGFYIPEQYLNAPINVKYRVGSEKFYWKGVHHSLKKLLQQWQIPPWMREKIPLIFIGNELALIANLAVSDTFFCKDKTYILKWNNITQ